MDENVLEASLVKAARDPQYRAQFYRDLLAAQVVVVPSIADAPADWREVEVGWPLRLRAIKWQDRPFVPLFSSVVRLKDGAPRPGPYAAVPARRLFESTRGSDLVLNPGSEYFKELLSQEVMQILDGTIGSKLQTEPGSIMLTTPVTQPVRLIDDLIVAFSRLPSVLQAWVALAHAPEHSQEPYFLIGVQAKGEWDSISAAGTDAIASSGGGYPRIELYRVSGSRGADAYFLRQRPFYDARSQAR